LAITQTERKWEGEYNMEPALGLLCHLFRAFEQENFFPTWITQFLRGDPW
jgi:hypothetical protein